VLKKGHLSFDVKGAIAQLTRLENNMNIHISRGYRDGKKTGITHHLNPLQCMRRSEYKRMQDMIDGYSHGCEDLESLW